MHTIKKSQIKGKGSKERELKMNKLLRKVMVLALAGTMTVGMNATVFAENTQTPTTKETNSQLTNGGNNVTSDTTTINLIKDYILGDGSDQDSSSPAEDFVFTITPYGVWNAGSSTGLASGGAYTVENMPALAKVNADGSAVDSPTVVVEEKTTKVTVKTEKSQADKTPDVKAHITLTDFNSVGDFWYQVEETKSNTTGVIYGTNDSETNNTMTANNGHNAIYYIHVQVVNNPKYSADTSSLPKFFRSVTLHKKAPIVEDTNDAPSTNIQYNNWAASNYDQSVKVNAIQNTYYAGDLSITKVVAGNSGDKDKRFEVTVTFTKPEDTIITSDIKYSAAGTKSEISQSEKTIVNQNADDSNWINYANKNKLSKNDKAQASNEVKFWIKDGETVTFKNIPYGVNYTIKETRPENDTYTHSFSHLNNTKNATESTFNGKKTDADAVTVEREETVTNETVANSNWNAAYATGSITDASDTVTITNTKVSTIDIGVITSNAPYIAMLLLVAAAAFVFVHRRKNMIEE